MQLRPGKASPPAWWSALVSSLAWIQLSGDTYKDVYGLRAETALAPFSQPAIVTIPLGFLTLVVVSLLTRQQTPVEPSSALP